MPRRGVAEAVRKCSGLRSLQQHADQPSTTSLPRRPVDADDQRVSWKSADFGGTGAGGQPGVSKKKTLTRREFLRAAGAGATGASLLGVAGCASFADRVPRLPEEYLPGGGTGPNVILVVIDTLRKDHVGAYGN